MHLFGGDPVAIADELRRRVREELGLSISVGVSFNKIFAKLGSDYKKPDATTLISPENWQEIVWSLPVGAMLFVGRSAQRTLAQYGVETIGQLAACRPEMIEQLLGKLGRQLHEYANGLDRSPVRPQAEREPVKSVGNGTTFPHDLTRWEEVRAGLAALSDSVAMRLRRQGLYCSGVQVTIKDSSFCSISRQKRLESPTRLMKDIQRAAMELTRSAWRAPTPIPDAHRHRAPHHRERRKLRTARPARRGPRRERRAAGKARERRQSHPRQVRRRLHHLRLRRAARRERELTEKCLLLYNSEY